MRLATLRKRTGLPPGAEDEIGMLRRSSRELVCDWGIWTWRLMLIPLPGSAQ